MRKGITDFLILVFIYIASGVSLIMQFTVVLGDTIGLTEMQRAQKETIIWRFIAIISICLVSLVYRFFKLNVKTIKWLSIPPVLLAVVFPITLGVTRVYQSFI